MIYAPHTFELTLILDSKKFDKMKSKVYKEAKGKHRVIPKKDGVHVDTRLADEGVKIEYHDSIYKKKVKFIINPTALLGGNDVKKLWKPNKDNISNMIKRINELIASYFDGRYKLNDFKLTRMDFTVNIDVGDSKNVTAYIKVLQNIGKVKGFSPKYDSKNINIDKNESFDLAGNSNDVEFSAYHKEAQLKKKRNGDEKHKYAKGLLRVEVRLMKQKAIRKQTNESKTAKQIKALSLNSQGIFMEIFTQIVPIGDYYKKKDAVKIVEEHAVKKIQREKMLRLIELIPKKKSLYLAIKEMDDRNIGKVMHRFAEINVSPVSISKRHEAKRLDSLYTYFNG